MSKNNKALAYLMFFTFFSLPSLLCGEVNNLKPLVKYLEKESSIDVQSLHLYKFLEYIKNEIDIAYLLIKELKNKLPDENQEVKEQLDSHFKKIQEEKNIIDQVHSLFKEIIHGLNLGGHPELRIKFINVSNYFDENKFKEGFEPRDLRAFREKLSKFDKYVKRECTNRSYFNHDVQLYDQIIQFNALIRKHLNTWQNYLNITVADKVVDNFIFRPYEWVCKNPVTSIILASLLIAGFSYFYVWPEYLRRTLKNQNPHVDVKQLPVLHQRGALCPIHALYNLRCLQQAKDLDEATKMANDRAAFNQFYDRCQVLRPGKSLQWLDDQEVFDLARGLTDTRGIPDINLNNVTIIPAIQSLNDTTERVQGGNGVEIIIPALVGIQAMNTRPGEVPEDFRNRYNHSIANGTPEFFVINTGNMHTGTPEAIKSSGGHWVTCAFRSDPTSLGGMRVIATNSTNSNITAHPAVNRICQILRENR